MAEVRIRTLKDGPYEVKGTVQLVDAAALFAMLTTDVAGLDSGR